jgi:hypothetical protein
MIQGILVALIFAGALAYLGRLVFRHFDEKETCVSGCGKCAVDFSKIEKQLAEKSTPKP